MYFGDEIEHKTYNEMEKTILKWGITSRFLIWTISFIFNLLIRDYDTSASIGTGQSKTDKLVELLFGQYVRWDSIYFVRIAEFNYEYEQTHAFFPLFPFLMNILSKGNDFFVRLN